MSKNTQYIVQSTAASDGEKLYPVFGKRLQLTAWTRRINAPRFTRAEAAIAAAALERHLKEYNAPDTVEVVPANGGAAIVRPRYVDAAEFNLAAAKAQGRADGQADAKHGRTPEHSQTAYRLREVTGDDTARAAYNEAYSIWRARG